MWQRAGGTDYLGGGGPIISEISFEGVQIKHDRRIRSSRSLVAGSEQNGVSVYKSAVSQSGLSV